MKKPVKDEALRTWVALNAELRAAGETRCQQLLRLERAGRNRSQFLKRIHSRLNRVRAARERQELEQST